MNLPDERLTPLLLLLAAFVSTGLGAGVLLRHPGRHMHKVYAALAFDVALWALALTFAMWSRTAFNARVSVGAVFAAAAFFPALYYQFCACCPNQRFEGVRSLLAFLYASGAALAVLAFTPWFVQGVVIFAERPPAVSYGPAFPAYSGVVLLALASSVLNLYHKWVESTGVRRRQLEHVFLGLVATGVVAAAMSLPGGVWPRGALAAYAPLVLLPLLVLTGYSLVRYHLLDLWLIASRTALYLVLTAFVMMTFAVSVGLVHWVFTVDAATTGFLSAALAALVVVLVLQPLKERVRLFLDRRLLKRRYDTRQLLARIGDYTTRFMHLDDLLPAVVSDIQRTMGVRLVRVAVESEKDPDTVVTEYSTRANEVKARSVGFDYLLAHVRAHPAPVVLEQLLHKRPEPEAVRLAHTLAELDTFVCVPLRTNKRVIGMLLLGHKTNHDIYTGTDLSAFETLAAPLGSAIENARLYRKLEEVNLHLERIMANMRGGVVAVDEGGTIRTVNHGAGEILGRIRAGQPLDVLKPEVAKLLRSALDEGRAIGDVETEIAGPDGERIPVLISVTPLLTNNGERLGAMALLFNLTQLKRLEANVRRADRLSSLGTVAAGMAHEIKNPLVSIKTFTQLLPARFEDPEFREVYLDVVPDEVERINTIVTRLLDFARPKPVVFAPNDLREIVRRTLVLVENQVRKAGITVTTDFPDECHPVNGDEQQLHQVFLNLLLNAIDALQESADRRLHVALTCDRVHLQPQNAPPRLDVECAKVIVSDSGCGMSGDKAEQVFTPFFTTKANGSGLGLAVVHSIVEGHGGMIDLSSIPGVGTIFSVTLPLVPGAAHVEPARS